MFVKSFMTTNPTVVSPNTSIADTLSIMKQNKLKRLPVMDKGRLVGLVTEADVMKALPSPATSLSKHEINYLTGKIMVTDVMSKNVVTASPDDTVELAVMVMREHDIGCLPVLENNQLVGIITESNVFDALTKLLGLQRPGIRITVEVPDKVGALADLTRIVKELGIPIISLATLPSSNDQGQIILRLATESAAPVEQALKDTDYQVTHIAQPH